MKEEEGESTQKSAATESVKAMEVPVIKVTEVPTQLISDKRESLPAMKKLNLTGLAAPSIFSGAAEQNESHEEQKLAPPPIKKALTFGIPKLNIGGLGLSEIIPESSNKTQIEID